MRVLLISIALLAGIVAGIATAGVAPRDAAPQAESSSVMAMRALLTHCMPGVAGGGSIIKTGFSRMHPDAERNLLGTREGEIWEKGGGKVLLIDFADAPTCRVVASKVDEAVLADLVIELFREQDGIFRRERFSFREDGSFAAVYTAGGPNGITVRVSTEPREGTHPFATLTVERTAR